jgi:ribosomal protein L7Ae-like RNA K-turn-binding protein
LIFGFLELASTDLLDATVSDRDAKVVKKGQRGVLAINPSTLSSAPVVAAAVAADPSPAAKVHYPMPKAKQPRIIVPSASATDMSMFAASSTNQSGAKERKIFTIPHQNAVIDAKAFDELQHRKRNKKPSKMKMAILHDRVEHFGDVEMRLNDAVAEWDAKIAERIKDVNRMAQDVVDTHGAVVSAQEAMAVALSPFAVFLLSPVSRCAIAEDPKGARARSFVAALDPVVAAYRKHRKTLQKLLEDRAVDVGAAVEPLNVTAPVMSMQTPPRSEQIDALRVQSMEYARAAILWNCRLFTAYEPVLLRLQDAVRAALAPCDATASTAADEPIFVVDAATMASLISAAGACEAAYRLYAPHAAKCVRLYERLASVSEQRDADIAARKAKAAAVSHVTERLDAHIEQLKAESAAKANLKPSTEAAKSSGPPPRPEAATVPTEAAASEIAPPPSQDDDVALDAAAAAAAAEPALPDDFAALDKALKSDSVIQFYKRLNRIQHVASPAVGAYVNNAISEELTSAVVAVLTQLDRLQLKGKTTGSVRAKRFDIGINAAHKRLEARSALCIFVAVDIEPVPTLLKSIGELQSKAHRRHVPLIFALTRCELAAALNRQTEAGDKQVSVVCVTSDMGANRELKALRTLWQTHVNRFQAEKKTKE